MFDKDALGEEVAEREKVDVDKLNTEFYQASDRHERNPAVHNPEERPLTDRFGEGQCPEAGQQQELTQGVDARRATQLIGNERPDDRSDECQNAQTPKIKSR